MNLRYTLFVKLFLFALICAVFSTDAIAQNISAHDKYDNKNNVGAIGLSYDLYDDDLEDWQRMFLEYSRITNSGPVLLRLNIGHRFDITDYQFEIDYWPKFSENWYGYFNSGISEGDLFPEIRVGAEIFRGLPRGFEASLGLRYLKFSDDDVTIFTGSVGKYIGNWLFIGRPYLTPQNSDLSVSFSFTARRYLGSPLAFSELLAGIGFSPDERRLLDGEIDERILKSRYIGIRTNYIVKSRFELFGEIKSTWQEFPFSDDFTRILTFEMGTRYRF